MRIAQIGTGYVGLTTGVTSPTRSSFASGQTSFINEIAELSERVGGDITQVAPAIGLDRRIGPRFPEAGIGWGGSCFGKDTPALLSMRAEYGVALPRGGDARGERPAARPRDRTPAGGPEDPRGPIDCATRRTFKAQPDGVRDSPGLDIARRLAARGAWVRLHDPLPVAKAARERAGVGVTCSDSVADVVQEADAIVLTTGWPEYRDLPWGDVAPSMRRPLLLDGRDFLDEKRRRASGFQYHGVGR